MQDLLLVRPRTLCCLTVFKPNLMVLSQIIFWRKTNYTIAIAFPQIRLQSKLWSHHSLFMRSNPRTSQKSAALTLCLLVREVDLLELTQSSQSQCNVFEAKMGVKNPTYFKAYECVPKHLNTCVCCSSQVCVCISLIYYPTRRRLCDVKFQGSYRP